MQRRFQAALILSTVAALGLAPAAQATLDPPLPIDNPTDTEPVVDTVNAEATDIVWLVTDPEGWLGGDHCIKGEFWIRSAPLTRSVPVDKCYWIGGKPVPPPFG